MPILEARFPIHRHWPINEEKRKLLKSNGFRWSLVKRVWWRLAGIDAEELAEMLRKKFIQVEIVDTKGKS